MTEIGGGGRPLRSILRSDLLARLETLIWPKGFSRDAWMIVDAARDPRIFGLLLECFYSQHECLFEGRLPASLRLAAPHLIQLDYDDRKTRRFLSQAWNNCWGIVLNCDARLNVLKRHLQTLLIVGDENANQLLFRYYDPRVLRAYLPTCTRDELRTVFGPISYFLAEDEVQNIVHQFSFAGDLNSKSMSLQ